MSYADEVFIETCKDILTTGTSTKNQEVRPHWPDGAKAYTIKKSCVVNRYDLRKEFPAITLRKIALRSAMDEILWIYQKKSNKICDLNSHIWDEWAGGDGTIGKAYGYQIGQPFVYKTVDGVHAAIESQRVGEVRPNGKKLESALITWNKDDCKKYDLWLDQTDAVLYQLKFEPFSRRIMTNTWNFQDLHEMGLQPCAYGMNYNVEETADGKRVLNAVLTQRSQDMLAANGWNVAQYAILLMMLAQVNNMIAGELVHVITDCHIYDRHIPLIEELIQREKLPAPKVWLNPEIKDFYDFTINDLYVTNYESGPQVKFPVAI